MLRARRVNAVVLQDTEISVKLTQYRLKTLLLLMLVTAVALTAIAYRSAFVQTAGERFIGSKDGMDLCESFEREIRAGMPLRTVQALIGWGYELPTNERDEFLRRIQSQPNSPQPGNDRVFVYTTNLSRAYYVIYRDDHLLNYDDILDELLAWKLRKTEQSAGPTIIESFE